MHYFRLFLALLILTVSACSKTTMTVKSNPPGAQVVMKATGITAVTDSKLELPEEEVFGRKESTSEVLIFTKEGYKALEKEVWLFKDKKNNITVDLEEYNTFLEIKSTPAPIHIHFVPSDVSRPISWTGSDADWKNSEAYWSLLPKDWPKEFTTPISLKCTEKEAKALSSYQMRVVLEDVKGYLPTGDYRSLIDVGYSFSSNLKPNFKNKMNISLKPVVTTLQIISEPEGAVVEDISTGGFGYLGTTPLVRNFNWEDVVLWSDRITTASESARVGNKELVGNKRKRLFGSSLYINLRLSKSGYQDTYLRRLRLPVGEERSFHKNMNALNYSLTFASDPAGVHVYVKRDREKETYNQEEGEFVTKVVSFNKHLGTTPFTINLDPNDPLIHGDELIFEKSGYNAGSLDFAEGEANYYKVMVPVNIMER